VASAADRRARRFAAGLAQLSPITAGAGSTSAGAPLVPVLLEGFAGAPPTGRWARLVALEGLGLADEGAASVAARTLAGEVPARSRRQALRTLLATLPLDRAGVSPSLVLQDPEALFDESPVGDVAGLGLELGLSAVHAGPRFGSAVGRLLGRRDSAAELLVWAAILAETERDRRRAPSWVLETVRASLRLQRDGGPGEGAGPFERARDLVRGDLSRAFGALVAWVDAELDPAERAALARLAVRADLASPEARRATRDRAVRALQRDRDDPRAVEGAWLDLASVAGDPEVGQAALATLEASLIEAFEGRSRGPAHTSRSIREAIEQAIAALERARRDDLARSFATTLRRAAGDANHPLAGRFLRPDWPPRRPLPPRDVERLAAPLPPQ
ncbi:MAG: hypothetical protein AAGA20_20480, partial [Planctomycetota bacterium]